MANPAWLDAMVTNLRTSGESVGLSFVMGNLGLFGQIGFDICNQACQLFQANRTDEAIALIDSKATEEQIEEEEEQDTDDLKTAVTEWNNFKNELGQVALKLLPAIVQVGEAVASGGLSAI